MSSAPQIRQGPENPAAQPPKPGDLVQIRQHLFLPDNTVAKPAVQSGKSEAWIYAEVLEPVYDSYVAASSDKPTQPGPLIGFRVKIKHAMNHQHGETLAVKAGDVRTVADVDNLAAKAATPELKRHFQVQADRLKKANAKPAAAAAQPRPIR